MRVVEMRGIHKRFGDVIANDQINFELEKGEIHALLGENGAGKTTLMRILYGLYHADEGEIFINQKKALISSPKNAIRLGIGMVTQHFTLVPTLNVAENLALGESGNLLIRPKEIQRRVGNACDQFGVMVNPKALVRHLSVGERQRVEILKALYRKASILILDEPTAVLVPQEVDVLFDALFRLRDQGLSVIFISHKLNEVMRICDRITVLRGGKVAGTVLKTATNQQELAKMMVGREDFGVTRQGNPARDEYLLRIEDLNAQDKKGLQALKGISLGVRAGEILGIAGVSGNGQTELTNVLTGMLKPVSGKVWLSDKEITAAEPDVLSKQGIGRIGEDRHVSLVGELTVSENLALEQLDTFTRNGVLDRTAMKRNAETLIREYQIKASANDCVRTLSGGNMQKVILARALYHKPRVVIASQPTRGLDISATDYVRSKLLEQRERGAAVLLLSEDLDEVMALSDRIGVIYEGKIVGIFNAQEATAEKLGMLMAGLAHKDTQPEEARCA
jgi:ABC-type uncharacterized transport system ATPase subunit